MKKKFLTGIFAAAMVAAVSFGATAQEKKTEAGKVIQKVGNKTAEVAVKGESKVADKVWKGKMAPDGSNVYINNKNEKYYVNKKGAKIWLKASEIKDKPKGK